MIVATYQPVAARCSCIGDTWVPPKAAARSLGVSAAARSGSLDCSVELTRQSWRFDCRRALTRGHSLGETV